jgi:hypothetical protein
MLSPVLSGSGSHIRGERDWLALERIMSPAVFVLNSAIKMADQMLQEDSCLPLWSLVVQWSQPRNYGPVQEHKQRSLNNYTFD